ncbi:MAG: hypothetical protein IJP90_08985 [Treponema sp.]|jgi:hypothetical protein|nr:hypothetical protein [Treponema sp.]MBR0099835.1 hypothetical protein [Treponema sp.]
MVEPQILLYIIKLVLGGIAAFLAIMLWSRTRDSAWICLVAGAVTGYAGIVYELLEKFGIILASKATFLGIPLSSLLFASIPGVFVILGFILMILRK